MPIHAASLEKSERLQRLLALLKQGGEYTTREIASKASIEAVSTAVSELRHQIQPEYGIKCRCIERGLYGFTLVKN